LQARQSHVVDTATQAPRTLRTHGEQALPDKSVGLRDRLAARWAPTRRGDHHRAATVDRDRDASTPHRAASLSRRLSISRILCGLLPRGRARGCESACCVGGREWPVASTQRPCCMRARARDLAAHDRRCFSAAAQRGPPLAAEVLRALMLQNHEPPSPEQGLSGEGSACWMRQRHGVAHGPRGRWRCPLLTCWASPGCRCLSSVEGSSQVASVSRDATKKGGTNSLTKSPCRGRLLDLAAQAAGSGCRTYAPTTPQ